MKTGELLKASRFNYSCKDKNGNLLLCNFAQGTYSFTKILKDDIEKYQELIGGDKLTFDENKKYITQLFHRGFLVEKNADEDLNVKSLYLNAVMNDTLSLIILPTEQCNFRCKYCYETFEKGKMTKEDQISLLKFIQKRLAYATSFNIRWFGGEPLVAFDVVEYIMENVKKICANKRINYSSDMTTNAYNLDPEKFDKLYKLKVYKYQITLDGLKEQHDKQRVKSDGSGTFDRIIENLLYIKNSPQYKMVRITIRVNITSEIFKNWDKFLDFYKSNFGGDVRFNLIFGPAGDYGGERVKEFEDQFVDPSDLFNRKNELGIYEGSDLNVAGIDRAFIPMGNLCYAGRKNSYVIGSDLNIYKCTVHFNMPENSIGRIYKNGDASIDHTLHNQWYAKDNKKTICKSCYYLPCCDGGGCPEKRNFKSSSESDCPFKKYRDKDVEDSMLYLSNRYEFKQIDFEGV